MIQNTEPNLDELNGVLRQIYECAWSGGLGQLPTNRGLSNPHFLNVPKLYGRVTSRLMVVGQQTFWWPQGRWYREGLGSDPVGDIMALYADFNLAATYSGQNSPFWAASNEIHAALNPGISARTFLWSNLVKIDQHQRRPEPKIEEAVSQFDLLPSEIRICRPDMIIFFTGPEYDTRLERSFPGARLEGLNGSPRRLARVTHPGLPRNTFRTYHPNHLRRSRQWQVLEEVAKHAREA